MLQITKANKTTLKKRADKKFLVDQVTNKEGSHGDLRVLRNRNGVSLNAKLEDNWYSIALNERGFRPYQVRYIQHRLNDSSKTANSYYWMRLTESYATSAASTTISDGEMWIIPVDCTIANIQWVQMDNTATGIYGWKIWKYDGGGGATDDVANYDVAKEATSASFLPPRGETQNMQINLELKRGDIIAVQHKSPGTNTFDDVHFTIILKEYWT